MGTTKRKILYLVIATLLALDIAVTTMLVLFLVGFEDSHDYRKEYDTAALIFSNTVDKSVDVDGTVKIILNDPDGEPFTIIVTVDGKRSYTKDAALGEYDVSAAVDKESIAKLHISVSKAGDLYTLKLKNNGNVLGITDFNVDMTAAQVNSYLPFDFNRNIFIDVTRIAVGENGWYRDATGFDTLIRGFLLFRSKSTGVNISDSFFTWVALQPVSGQITYDNGSFSKMTVLQKSTFDVPLKELDEIMSAADSPLKAAVTARSFALGGKTYDFSDFTSISGGTVTNFTLNYGK